MKNTMSLEAIRQHETLNQVSILQSLSQGDFSGFITVADLKKLGDTGIGTFDGLDGELVMLGGEVYRARADGRTAVVPEDATVPFADVTFMTPQILFEINAPCDLEGLKALLNEEIACYNANLFYMATISCRLSSLKVRTAIPRCFGDETLAEYMEGAQVVFEHGPQEGDIVALYCPEFMASLNLPGWHFHFLSKDTTVGGHVLGLQLEQGFAALDQTCAFNMVLPDNDMRFAQMDLTKDQSADLQKVEADG